MSAHDPVQLSVGLRNDDLLLHESVALLVIRQTPQATVQLACLQDSRLLFRSHVAPADLVMKALGLACLYIRL